MRRINILSHKINHIQQQENSSVKWTKGMNNYQQTYFKRSFILIIKKMHIKMNAFIHQIVIVSFI